MGGCAIAKIFRWLLGVDDTLVCTEPRSGAGPLGIGVALAGFFGGLIWLQGSTTSAAIAAGAWVVVGLAGSVVSRGARFDYRTEQVVVWQGWPLQWSRRTHPMNAFRSVHIFEREMTDYEGDGPPVVTRVADLVLVGPFRVQIETLDPVDAVSKGRRFAKKMQAQLVLANGTIEPYVRELPTFE